MKIGIVGGGFVGSATALLECPEISVIVYDLDPARCKPAGVKFEELSTCDLVFVCVPTPTHADGSCNTRIVESAINSLKAAGIQNIVLRSTVPPGTAARLDVDFMPEFLTEANWRADFYNCALWVFGVRSQSTQALLDELILTAHKNGVIKSYETKFVKREEAELIKYTRNNFLALKISFFNEIASLCAAIGADYESVRSGVGADPRIGASHTAVPGPDGHRGFGGTCLPKDTSALESFMKSHNVTCPVISGMVHRNRNIDRPEHDWEADPRAFTAAVREGKPSPSTPPS
jgi:UDPglucose 6-dehydrogenase